MTVSAYELVKKTVESSIERLLLNDSYLLEIGVHERTLSHKLAEYLQQVFSSYHVDVEYNRHEFYIKELRSVDVFPDIIVHLRGSQSNNLLVIEIKVDRSKRNKRKETLDKNRLCEFTNHGGPYGYRFGLFLIFGHVQLLEAVWFENGQEK